VISLFIDEKEEKAHQISGINAIICKQEFDHNENRANGEVCCFSDN
jgi:hypothetical protein